MPNRARPNETLPMAATPNASSRSARINPVARSCSALRLSGLTASTRFSARCTHERGPRPRRWRRRRTRQRWREWSGRNRASELLDLQVVRVVRDRSGLMLTRTTLSPALTKPRHTSCCPISRPAALTFSRNIGADRNDAPVRRQPARHVGAIGRGDDRHARSKRRTAAVPSRRRGSPRRLPASPLCSASVTAASQIACA